MRTVIFTSLAALAFAATTPMLASAEEEHRELGAHEHGHGTLNIAVEDKHVSMELEAPGMDIVGFEHAASTGAQQDAVAKAKAALSDPLALFKLPASAGCTVHKVDVEIETEQHENENAADDGHEKHASEHGDGEQDKHADSDHDEHAGHNEFHVTYALDCAKPAELTSIGFDYFKSFAGARRLSVNVVTDKGQSSYEVSRDKPELDLTGVM